MNATCDRCGYNPSAVRASLRRALAECEGCGATLCEECLKEMAVEKGLMSELDAKTIMKQYGVGGFLKWCEESDMDLCPECFEDGAEQG